MQKDFYEKIISFLLGASWAIIFFGALLTFKIFLFFGFVVAFFAMFLSIFIFFFLLLFLDAFQVNKDRLKEAKKQRELLEKIYQKKF